MHRYSKQYAYGQSKLANILHANELARRLKVCRISTLIAETLPSSYFLQPDELSFFFLILEQEEGTDITVNSLHPGLIVTNLFRHSNIVTGNSIFRSMKLVIQTKYSNK